ncbi:hypothetical protein [Streptomyces sp. NPDC054834]
MSILQSLSRQSDLSLLSRPVYRELAAVVGETVNLAMHDGLEVITIDQELPNWQLTPATSRLAQRFTIRSPNASW